MKKLLSVALCLVLIFSALPIFTITANAATSGHYTYTISSGEATITNCDASISGNVTIPSTLGGCPVTAIGSEAFYYCTSLTSVAIPDSVTEIGSGAFFYCTSLVNIAIPDSVTSIGDNAFYYCTSLANITIPDSVTTISDFAFFYCTSLVDITIPDSVTTIGSSAFSHCGSLAEITIPDNVKIIGEHAFYYCTCLVNITIPDSVTSIGNGVFDCCDSLTNITIPDSVTSIGNYAFAECDSLAEITIPDSVKTVGEHAFYNCESLANISIPDSVTSIGSYAFAKCDSLVSITIGNSVTSVGDWALSDCKALTSIVIPDSVTSIGEHAFYNCTLLTNIAIPDGITSIGIEAFYNTAYYNNSNNWEEGVLYVGKHLIDCKTDITNCVIKADTKSIAELAFSYCTSLTSIVIPDGVTTIGVAAFVVCDSLTSVTIPDSVTSIGDDAFSGCASLEKVYYRGDEDNKKRISIGAFNDCLTNATWCYNSCIGSAEHSYDNACDPQCNRCGNINETASHTTALKFSTSNATDYPFSLKDGIYHSTNTAHSSSATFTITAQNSGALKLNYYTSTEPNYDELVIKHNSTTVATASGDTSWADITINLVVGDKVYLTYSKDGSNSSNDDRVYFKILPVSYSCEEDVLCTECGAVVKEATNHTYDNGCDSVCNICGAIREISAHVYDNNGDADCNICGAVRYYTYTVSSGEVTITDCDTSISGDVTIPSNLGGYPVTAIGERAFVGCGALTKVTISKNVTTIGERAFYNCKKLTSITIPDSVTSIGTDAFYNTAYYNNDSNWVNDALYIDNHLIEYYGSATNYSIKVGTKTIVTYAFSFCDSLTEITIPDSVVSIGDDAFNGCTSLKKVYYTGNEENRNRISIGAFNDCLTNATWHYNSCIGSAEHSYENEQDAECNVCGAIREVENAIIGSCGDGIAWKLNLDTKVLTLTGTGATYDYVNVGKTNPFTQYRFDIKHIVIGDGITRLGNRLFKGLNHTASVTFGKDVTTMGYEAFYGCTKLADVNLNEGLTELGSLTFYNCTALKQIEIPSTVTKLNNRAFKGAGLTSVVVPDTVKTMGYEVFMNCANLETVDFTKGVSMLNPRTFENCTSLKEFSFTKNMCRIRTRAFYGCTALQSIIFEDANNMWGSSDKSEAKIASNAFEGCNSTLQLIAEKSSHVKDYAQNRGFTFVAK